MGTSYGPLTLAYLAGHRDMNITKRYIHPQEHTIRQAIDRARVDATGHSFGHTGSEERNTSAEETALLN
jgi:hypothetical protein